MKKFFISVIAAAALLATCGCKSSKNSSATTVAAEKSVNAERIQTAQLVRQDSLWGERLWICDSVTITVTSDTAKGVTVKRINIAAPRKREQSMRKISAEARTNDTATTVVSEHVSASQQSVKKSETPTHHTLLLIMLTIGAAAGGAATYWVIGKANQGKVPTQDRG